MADASRAGGNLVGALNILEDLEESGYELTFHRQIGLCLIRGSVYYELSNHTESIIWAKKGLDLCSAQTEMDYKSLLHNLLGASYIETNADSAIKYIHISIKEFYSSNDSAGAVLPIINLARLHMERGEDREAIDLIENSVKILDMQDVPVYRKMAYDYLSKLYYRLKEYKKSVEYFQVRDSVNYEINNSAIAFQIAEYQGELDKQKNANDILALEAQVEIGNIKSERDNTLLVLGIVMVVFLGLFLFYSIKTNRNEKALNADLKKKTNELENVVAFKAKILSVISHDMRSPLAQLVTFQQAKTAGIDFTDEEISEMDASILSSTKNGLLVLDNLLKWANSQFGGLDLNFSVFNSKSAIAVIVDQIGLLAKEKSILINSELASINVNNDEAFFQIIIRNLMNNAVKFSPIKSEVIVRSTQKDTSLVVEVIDYGLGIPEDVIESLKQAKEVKSQLGSEGEKGTGIGLRFSIDFAKKMGGSIAFKRGKERGTIATFTIPVGKV
jgi:signal transduction histidine kinase